MISACGQRVRRQDQSAHALRSQRLLARRQRDLHILIAPIGAAGRIDGSVRPVGNVKISHQSRTQVGLQYTSGYSATLWPIGVSIPALVIGTRFVVIETRVKLLAITDDDRVAALQESLGKGYLGHSHHIDTHIIGICMPVGTVHRHHPLCTEPLTHTHRTVVARLYAWFLPGAHGDDLGRPPSLVRLVGRCAPAFCQSLLTCIINLSVEE